MTARSDKGDQCMLGNQTVLIAALVLVAAVVMVAIGWFALRARRLARSLEAWHDDVREVASDASVGRRLTVQSDELVPLSRTVNQLFDAIDSRDQALAGRDIDAMRLANALADIVLIHTDRILFANTAAAALLGIDASALVDKPVTDLAKPAYRALLGQTTARRLAGETVPERQEMQFIDVDTGALWVELVGVTTQFRDQPAVMTVARDITARKSPTAQASGTPTLLDRALSAIAESVVTTDRQGVVTSLNRAAAETLGILPRDAVGVPFGRLVTLVDEVDHKTLGNPVERCLALRQRVNMGRRALLLRPSGSDACSVEMSASPIDNDEGELVGVAVVFHDVSELRGHSRKVSYQASHDALTGLINRPEFED
ncbi:MAG: PAS domain S-box protein, partial [Pseudomonadota bacterium]